MGQGAEDLESALEAQEAKEELLLTIKSCRRDLLVEEMKSRYEAAKKAAVGYKIECPSCRKPFIKRSYQQAFCSNTGSGNCKDYYRNRADPQRLARAKKFSRDYRK